MKNKILVIALFSLFSTCVYAEDVLSLYSGVAKEWKIQISEAFDKAEKEVYNVVVVPDEEIVEPDPDVKKCPCRGTGNIVHVSNCPDGKCPLVAMAKKTTCQCETKCGCKICKCNKMEIK
jgi:hypothetical protein